MKKIVKKLSLNKQTMALLDEKEMMNVKGGLVLADDGGDEGDATSSKISCWSLARRCTRRSCKSAICF